MLSGKVYSNTFEVLVNKPVTQQYESFLASKSFQNMLHSTTKTIVSQIVCDSVVAVVAKEIDKAVQPLLNTIADLDVKLNQAKSHANENE